MPDLPDFTEFRVPQDLRSEPQLRIAFERLLRLQNEQVAALGVLDTAIGVLEGAEQTIQVAAPVTYTDGTIGLATGNGLSVESDQLVASIASPLQFSDMGVIGVNIGGGLEVNEGALRLDLGAGLAFAGNDLQLSDANLTAAQPPEFAVLVFNTSNIPLTIASTDLFELIINSTIDIFDNGFTWVNLPLNNIPGTMTAAQWNNTTRNELEAIFLALVAFCQSIQATINANNSNMVASPLFVYG